ncbi:hypothetical protein A6I85_05830 [Prescottella equi]|nr:hypothetical protein A6I85_05830 [Prescottella equi]
MSGTEDRRQRRVATRDLDAIDVLGPCLCGRPHRSHLEYAKCALPAVVWVSSVNGEFAVIAECFEEPHGSMFRSLGEAARRFDTANAWQCGAPKCRGAHSLWAVLP